MCNVELNGNDLGNISKIEDIFDSRGLPGVPRPMPFASTPRIIVASEQVNQKVRNTFPAFKPKNMAEKTHPRLYGAAFIYVRFPSRDSGAVIGARMNKRVDYTPYLKPGETIESVDIGTLRKRKWDSEQKLSQQERDRLAGERAEQAEETAAHQRLGLLYFSETKRNTPAATLQEEINAHRSFLRAMDKEDVREGESLRQLAYRTWISWLRGQAESSGDAWACGYNPASHKFEFNGFLIPGGGEPGYFADTWFPPADCTGDELIDVHALKNWPNFGRVIVPDKPKREAKPEPLSEPPPQRLFRGLVPALTPYSTVDGPQSNATVVNKG
jgi:hypothetical protein